GDGPAVASPDFGDDVSVSEIALAGDVNRTHELVCNTSHRRHDDEPTLLGSRGNDLRNLSKTARVGDAGAAEFMNNARWLVGRHRSIPPGLNFIRTTPLTWPVQRRKRPEWMHPKTSASIG